MFSFKPRSHAWYGVAKKIFSLQRMGDILMRSKFLSVVKRDGVHEVVDRLEATHGCPLCSAGGRTPQFADFGELRLSLDQREQATFVSGADDGSPSQSPQASFARDNGRTLGNVGSIWDQAASGVFAGTLVITFSVPPRLRHKLPPSRLSCQIIWLIRSWLSLIPWSRSQPLICSGDQRIWRNFASILRRTGAVSLRGTRIVCRA